MSNQEVDLLKQMAGEDTNLASALVDKPPQLVNQMPELDAMGLDKFRPHMTENGYNTFLTIMHWAVLCQKLSDGEQLKWDDATYAAMSAGFVGFGNPLQWESTYQTNISKIVHNIYFNWHGYGAGYRKKHKLPHLIIEQVAPAFANTNRGYQHSQYIRDLIADKTTHEHL